MKHPIRIHPSHPSGVAIAPHAAWQEGMDRFQWIEGLGQRAVVGGLSGTNPFVAAWNGGPWNADPGGGLKYTHAFESSLLGGYDVSKLPEPVQFALDLVTQTLTDPITYAPGLDLLVLASKAGRFAEAIKLIAEAAQKVPELKKAVDKAAPVLHTMISSLPAQVAGKILGKVGATIDTVTGARLARAVAGAGVRTGARILDRHIMPYVDTGYEMRKEAGRYAERRVSRDVIMPQARHDQRTVRYDALMKKWGRFMDHTGSIPMPVREELDRLSYLLGTKEVRNDAIRHGFRPTAEERASPIVNRITTYEVHYEPKQRLRPEPGTPPVVSVKVGGFKKGKAPFDMPQTVGDEPLAPLSQRVHERLNEESRDLRNHSAAMRSMQNYGLLGKRVNTFRTVNGKRVADTTRGQRFTNETLDERVLRARQRGTAALEAGDLKRATRYRKLIEKQKKLQGGANAVTENVGELNLTKEQAERRAIKATIEKGLTGQERAVRRGKLTAREKLTPMMEDLRTKRMHTTRLQNLARKAMQGTEKTQVVADTQADRLSRLLTERNADFRDTLRVVRDKTRKAVEGKPKVLGENGPIFDLPHLGPVTQRRKLTKDELRILSPSEQAHNKYSWTETEGQGIHVRPLRRLVAKPSARVAGRVKDLAEQQLGMTLTSAKKLRAADQANQFRRAVRADQQRQLDLANRVSLPKALKDRIYNIDPVVKNNWLAQLAQTGRDMMFITSAPHKVNVAGLGMGTERGSAIPLSATAGGVAKIIKGNRQGRLLRNTAEAEGGLPTWRQRMTTTGQRILRKPVEPPSGVKELEEQYLKGRGAETLSPARQQAYNALQRAKANLAKAKSKSEPIEESLIQVGAPVKYSRRGTGFGEAHDPPAYQKGWMKYHPATRKIADWLERHSNASSDSLHRFETGLRSAELEKLKKRGIVDPVTQGGELRDAYGNYYERSKLVRHLQDNWGAPFAQYRAGVIPRAATKMVTQAPRSAHELLNLIRDFNYDVSEPTFGGDIRPGGNVLSESSEIIGRPQHYAFSASTVGPIATAAGLRDKTNPGAGRAISNAIIDYTLPMAPSAKSLVNSDYHKALRLMLSTFGWDLDPVKQRAPYYPAGYSPR